MRTIAEMEQALLQYADQQIETGDADDGFAYGYLSGHISVIAAECEAENASNLVEKLSAALLAHKQELSPADQALVLAAWETLQQAVQGEIA